MRMELTAIGWIAAALVVALLIAFISTPVVKSLAQMVGAIDVPKDNRRMHSHPIPRMGGLAIFLGFLLSTLIFVPMSTPLRGMLLGGVIIVILGIFDDIYALPAMPNAYSRISTPAVSVSRNAMTGASRLSTSDSTRASRISPQIAASPLKTRTRSASSRTGR